MAAPALVPDLSPPAPEPPSLLGAGNTAGAAALSHKLDAQVHRKIDATFGGLVVGASDSAATDRTLATIRANLPQARFIRFRDIRTGHEWLAVFEPGSDWHQLLPDEQSVLIHTREDAPRTE
jgi:hypothetical protein